MSDLADRLSRALAGRYVIQRELDSGGMATVFLAEDVRHHRRVAIKVPSPDLALSPQRFLREIEVVAGLNHPHILSLHDSGSADELLFYVMPFAEGGSLRQRLEKEKQLTLEDALRIAREVADALEHAHQLGVVHRDIKPENILFQGGHAVVADFGIARALAAAGGDRMTKTGVAIGTPAYMSPEQAAGERDVDRRSDVYSLGCVLYEMLIGQPPFTAATAESLVYQHLSVKPRPVRELRPSVPEHVERAISRALTKTAADRTATAAALATAFDGLAPMPRRRRLWLALAGGAALVVTAIALLTLHPWQRHAVPARPEHAPSAIAVLPFQDLSDTSHAYFAGGLHDELLTQLAKVAALQVISRTSVMPYVGTSKAPGQIADELGVGSLVEGSVQVERGRLRVSVKLIDAAKGTYVWTERYDQTLDDAFAIQSEIAQKIVAALGAALSAAEQGKLAATPTANAEAYRLYLRGREYYLRPGLQRYDRERAQQYYEQALVLDPNFALAHAALSLVHGNMYWNHYDPSAARAARQLAEAETALRLEPDLPQAHQAMGLVHFVRRQWRPAVDELTVASNGLPSDGDLLFYIGVSQRRLGHFNEALEAYEKGKKLNPNDANLHFYLGGMINRNMRRFPEAASAYGRAVSLEPGLHFIAVDRAWMYVLWQGQLDTLRAVLDRLAKDADFKVAGHRAELYRLERKPEDLLRTLATASADDFVRPGDPPRSLYLAWARELRGDRAAARTAFDSACVILDATVREHPQDYDVHRLRGLALAGLGRREAALNEARWLQQSPIYRDDPWEGPILAEYRAQILAQAGEAEAALDEIERQLEKPSSLSVHMLRLDPLWDPIREQPRFQALLKKYGARAA